VTALALGEDVGAKDLARFFTWDKADGRGDIRLDVVIACRRVEFPLNGVPIATLEGRLLRKWTAQH